ncbi:hypothetical protein V8B97DRAFT_2005124 [Scleroderma yunnanense]
MQQVQSGSDNSEKSLVIPIKKPLTSYQGNRIRIQLSRRDPGNRTRVGVKTVKLDLATPNMQSLTCYQGNRTKVNVDSAMPDMQSLTSYQDKGITMGMNTVKRIQLNLA